MDAMELYSSSGFVFPVFPTMAVENTPSRTTGMDPTEERKMRVDTCHFITNFGAKKLRFPIGTIATACVFFHRYYARHVYDRGGVEATALACLLLASKAEGTVVKIRNFCTLYHQFKGVTPPTFDSDKAKKFEELLSSREAELLQVNEFTLWVEHPFKYFFLVLRLKLLESEGEKRLKEIAKYGYQLVLASFCTNLCVRYSPQEIAVAVLHTLADHFRLKIPQDSPFVEWYSELCPELSEDDLKLISSTILVSSVETSQRDNPKTTSKSFIIII